MTFRVIQGLRTASVLLERPSCIPKGRARGKKAAGLRYERELAKALPKARHGQWFQFEDLRGPGWCQVDLLLEEGGVWLILEAKYTWTQVGHNQIQLLYKPVIERATGQLAVGVVVCKVLTQETPKGWVCRGLEEARSRALCGLPTVLHWIGSGLGPLQTIRPRGHLADSLASL